MKTLDVALVFAGSRNTVKDIKSFVDAAKDIRMTNEWLRALFSKFGITKRELQYQLIHDVITFYGSETTAVLNTLNEIEAAMTSAPPCVRVEVIATEKNSLKIAKLAYEVAEYHLEQAFLKALEDNDVSLKYTTRLYKKYLSRPDVQTRRELSEIFRKCQQYRDMLSHE